MKKRRLLSTLLVVSAALSFAACGKKKTTNNNTSKTTTKEVTTKNTTTKDTTPAVESFKVTFNTNGGTTINDADVVKGNKVDKPNDPTKKGYIFSGWFKDSTLNTEFKFDEETINEKTTIYAKWEADDVEIVFINNATSEVTGETSSINKKFDESLTLPNGNNYESLNYTFVGWTTTNYTFGTDTPTVEYDAGVEVSITNLAEIYKDGKIKFYAVFEKNEYTYTVTKVDSTLAKDGYIEYKCNEDPKLSYTEILKKEDIFYARPIDASNIGDKVDIKVEVMQSEIKDSDKITIGLKNDRVINDIQVVGMSKDGGYVSSAKVGDIVDIIVTGSITASDVCLTNGLVCANNKAILNDELYLRVDLLDSSEGGKTTPLYEDYILALNLYGNQVQNVVVDEIYYTNYTKTTEAHPGQSYLLKVFVPTSSNNVFAWRGISGTLKEADSSLSNIGLCEVLGSTVSEFKLVTIRVDKNDGTTDFTTFEVSSDLYISGLPKLYRSGYKFLGYYSDTSYDDKDVFDLFNEGETVAYWYTKGIYAIWEKVEGFTISTVAVIQSRGTVVTSTSATPCAFSLNDVVLIYTNNEVVESVITGIAIGNKTYDDVIAGTENVSLLLRGIEKDQIKAGDVLIIKPIS